MFFVATGILGDHHDAEDVVQESVLAMFLNIKNLRIPEAFDSWMTRIVRTKCAKRLQERSGASGMLDIDDEDVDIEDSDEEFLPESYVENAERRNLLYDVIRGLPSKRREVVLMYYYEHLSYKEIADITDTSIGTVSSNISKARKMIRERLQQHEKKAQIKDAGSSLVISRALEAQALCMIPDSMVNTLHTQWAATMASLKYPVAASVIAKNIAVVAVCSTMAVGGVTVAHQNNSGASADPASGAQSEVAPKGEIRFTGGDSQGDHLNPSSSLLTIRGIDAVGSVPDWRIEDKTTGKTVATGSGYKVTDAFDELKRKGRTGKYTLVYRLTDENGETTAHREFEITD
jgi:RNA polymerase sigma-70 factor (ECF subfamily)